MKELKAVISAFVATILLLGLVVGVTGRPRTAVATQQWECTGEVFDVWAPREGSRPVNATIYAEAVKVTNDPESQSTGNMYADGVLLGPAPVAAGASVIYALPNGADTYVITGADGLVSVTVQACGTSSTTTTEAETTTTAGETTTTTEEPSSTTTTTQPPVTSSTAPPIVTTTTGSPTTSLVTTTSVPPDTTTPTTSAPPATTTPTTSAPPATTEPPVTVTTTTAPPDLPPDTPPPYVPPTTQPPTSTPPTTNPPGLDNQFPSIECHGADLAHIRDAHRVEVNGTIIDPTGIDNDILTWTIPVRDGDTIAVYGWFNGTETVDLYEQNAAGYGGEGDCVNGESG